MSIFWLIAIILIAIFSLWLLRALFSVAIKLLIAVLIIVVLFSVFANAAETKVFGGYVFSDQSITVDDKPFIIRFDYNPSSITINYNQKYFFINEGKCEDLMNLRFCYGNYLYDLDKKKYKANISVYSVAPEIAITRKINSSQILVGEETEVTLNVTNGIGISAENFTLTDSYYPSEFIVSDVSSLCSNVNNTVYYHGFLRERDYIRCSYKLTPVREIKRETRAKVSYYDGVEMKDVFSSPISFDVKPFITVSSQFNETDKEIFVGDSVVFSVNFTNLNQDLDTYIDFLDITLPSGLRYNSTYSVRTAENTTLRSQQVEVSGNKVHFSGKLDRNDTKFIIIKLNAVKSGSSNIFINAKYSSDTSNGTIELKDTIKVINQEVGLYPNFKDGELFDSGEEKYLKFYIANPSETTKMKNVILRVDSPIYNFSISNVGDIGKLSSKNALNQKVTMPDAVFDRDFSINATVYYENEFGEEFEKKFEYTIRVEATRGLVVSHEFSESSVQEGEEITVKTKVENRRNADIKGVRIFDVMPVTFFRKGLNSVSNININGLDTVTAYEYKITAPTVSKDTNYIIRSVATFFEDNKTYAYEKEDTVTVTKKKLELSISNAVSDKNPHMGAILDVLYTITNTEDEIIKNIAVKFPVQEVIELVGYKNYSIGDLQPGESFTMKDVHRIRTKENGSLIIAPATFIYEDEEGNIFLKNSSELSFTPEFGYIAGPAFTITQTAPNMVRLGDNIKVTLRVKNIGTEPGSINVIDGISNWIFNLGPGESETAAYTFGTIRAGEFNVKPLKGEYYYIGKKVYTVSNDVNVTIFREAEGPIAVEEKAPEEKITVTQEVVKKTFFDNIVDIIKEVFGFLKRQSK